MSADTDICDSHFSNLGSANLDALSCIKVDHMDGLGSGLGDRLNDHVVARVLMDFVVEHLQLLALSIFKDIFNDFTKKKK